MTDVEKKERRRWLFWLVALFIMGGVFWLSNISDLSFFRDVRFPSFITWLIKTFRLHWGPAGGYFSYSISLHPDYLIHKAGHIVMHGLLGLSLYLATGRSLRLTLLIVVMFAFSDEWHQSMVPRRSGRFFDVVLDGMAALGFILALKKSGIRYGAKDWICCETVPNGVTVDNDVGGGKKR